MRFWRVSRNGRRSRYAVEAGRGEGARLFGGRWNRRGATVVYASTSLALAAVETFVNLEPNLRPADLVSIEGRIPDGVEVLTLDEGGLARGWRRWRDESLRRFGGEGARLNQVIGSLGGFERGFENRGGLLIEAAGNQQRSTYFRPALLRQGTYDGPEAIPLTVGEMIKVHRAGCRHAVFFGEQQLRL
jgi:RES domain